MTESMRSLLSVFRVLFYTYKVMAIGNVLSVAFCYITVIVAGGILPPFFVKFSKK